MVGASGVGVNLGALALFSQLGMKTSHASALAIEVSIISNFLMNGVWTFKDQSQATGRFVRGMQFQLVSFVGGDVQWITALIAGVVIFTMTSTPDAHAAYFHDGLSLLERYLWLPIDDPPEIGGGKYVAQLVGIGLATVWNYLANFYWTWRAQSET